MIARMDAVVSTRLHGAVLALKNGVPVVMVDAVPGGSKVRAQAEAIDWPIVLSGETLTSASMEDALTRCLTEAVRLQARQCGDRAGSLVEDVRPELFGVIRRYPAELT